MKETKWKKITPLGEVISAVTRADRNPDINVTLKKIEEYFFNFPNNIFISNIFSWKK
jgi:hypothetical protein